MVNNTSVWHENFAMDKHKTLNGDTEADVAVVGGGLVGILTAYFLQEAGYKTIVLEADTVGSGQTGNSTAKITSQHGFIYNTLIEKFGIAKARQYANANEKAISQYKEIIKKMDIDCDFEETDAYIYSTYSDDEIMLEAEAAKKVGIECEVTTDTELPFKVKAALKFKNQAKFNPLKFLNAISDKVEVYEHTKVLTAKGNELKTSRGTVRAKYIVFACHYPIINFPGAYFMKMHQERSYVTAFENAKNISGMYYGIDADGLSFRSYKDLLFVGGANHRTGENSAGGKYDELISQAKKYWPGSTLKNKWSAQDCITVDGVPYIGKYCVMEPNWYVATGFKKWGISTSMVSAQIITDLIVDGKSENAEVFSPQRFTPIISAKSTFTEVVKTTKGLTREFLKTPNEEVEMLPKGHGGVVTIDGEKYGVYKDESGRIFTVSTRCPHLGCRLEWNPDEKSWDCPCHGSRFDYMGHLIDNPAQIDLDTKE